MSRTAPVTFSETAHYDLFSSAHNIVINEESGFAYAVGLDPPGTTCNGGLHMIDIHTPTNPVFAGCFSGDGYTHDAQAVIYHGPDLNYAAREIVFASNEDTLTIVDVTVKASPVMLSRTGYGGASYTHQCWLTEDHRHLLLSDEQDEIVKGYNTHTHIWSVENLAAPYVAFLVFPRWAGAGLGIVGHVETPVLWEGRGRDEVLGLAHALRLTEVKRLLDEAIQRKNGED